MFQGIPSLLVAQTGTTSRYRSITFTTSNAGNIIAIGKVPGYFTCPYAGTITGWNITADTGACTIQTWKVATGTAVPTVSNSISTSGVSLASGTAKHSADTSHFMHITVAAYDIFAFNVSAVTSATQLSFGLQITPR